MPASKLLWPFAGNEGRKKLLSGNWQDGSSLHSRVLSKSSKQPPTCLSTNFSARLLPPVVKLKLRQPLNQQLQPAANDARAENSRRLRSSNFSWRSANDAPSARSHRRRRSGDRRDLRALLRSDSHQL